jgi:hypothetical protein
LTSQIDEKANKRETNELAELSIEKDFLNEGRKNYERICKGKSN